MPDLVRHLALAALAAIAIIGCSASGGASTTGASAGPTAAPSAAAPSAAEAVGPPMACLGLGPGDCLRAREAATAELTPADPPVVYVQVGGFGCPVEPGCPTTLAARPDGDVSVEFAEGAGINVHVTALPDGTIEATRGESMGVAVAPASPAAAPGPTPFTLGHCGLFSGIDIDGSYWVPVGLVDYDHPDAINAASGVFAPTDPDHATFTSTGGLVVTLQRHPGAKLLPLCM